jgi:structural maintenance of chromosome 1
MQSKIAELRQIVDAADDDVFTTLCRRIGVPNIREYEDKQLRLVQDQAEASLQFEKQIARLKNQYALRRLPLG